MYQVKDCGIFLSVNHHIAPCAYRVCMQCAYAVYMLYVHGLAFQHVSIPSCRYQSEPEALEDPKFVDATV